MKTLKRTGIHLLRSLGGVALTGLLMAVFSTQTSGDELSEVDVEGQQESRAVATELPEFGDWRDYLEPGDRWLFWMLEQPVPSMELPAEAPLSVVLDKFAAHFTQTYGQVGEQTFAMTFWRDYATLELENIDDLDDVIITTQDAIIPPVKLKSALRLVFERTNDPPLSYVIRHGVIQVTTVEEARSENALMTRIYPVKDLIDGVETFGSVEFGSGAAVGAAIPLSSAETFRQLVVKMTASGAGATWKERPGQDGPSGMISVFRGHLVVVQTSSGHASVAHLLKLLRRTAITNETAAPTE